MEPQPMETQLGQRQAWATLGDGSTMGQEGAGSQQPLGHSVPDGLLRAAAASSVPSTQYRQCVYNLDQQRADGKGPRADSCRQNSIEEKFCVILSPSVTLQMLGTKSH